MYEVYVYHRDDNRDLVKYAVAEALETVDLNDIEAWRNEVISTTPASQLEQAPVLALITNTRGEDQWTG